MLAESGKLMWKCKHPRGVFSQHLCTIEGLWTCVNTHQNMCLSFILLNYSFVWFHLADSLALISSYLSVFIMICVFIYTCCGITQSGLFSIVLRIFFSFRHWMKFVYKDIFTIIVPLPPQKYFYLL